MKSLCVYCGSSGANDDFLAAARELGSRMAAQGIRLVYGGGQLGLMGAVAGAVLDGGGSVIGIIPRALHANCVTVEHKAPGDVEEVCETMHDRKRRMEELSDAFVALPGGWGTLEEVFEIVTHQQLGIHCKPVAMLNIGGYYDPIIAWVENASRKGMMRHEDRGRLHFVSTVDEVMALFEMPVVPSQLNWHATPKDL